MNIIIGEIKDQIFCCNQKYISKVMTKLDTVEDDIENVIKFYITDKPSDYQLYVGSFDKFFYFIVIATDKQECIRILKNHTKFNRLFSNITFDVIYQVQTKFIKNGVRIRKSYKSKLIKYIEHEVDFLSPTSQKQDETEPTFMIYLEEL